MCQNGYCKLMYIRKICKTFLSNTISPYLKPVSKGTYLFSGSNHVHPCALNKGVQVVSVAEYIFQVSQGQYKLFFFKMLFYATTWLSEKFLDSFGQFENTSEHSVTGQTTLLRCDKEVRRVQSQLRYKKLETDGDSKHFVLYN